MRILFISGWSTDNGLSRSTVHPHLTQLTSYDSVEKILYVSIESEPCDYYKEVSGKVEHAPIVKRRQAGGLASSIVNQIAVRGATLAESERINPDIVICRGAQAGALGYMIWKKYGVPYYVESFEPHAEYMAESGVWRRYGIRYLVQKIWERRIKGTAAGLITVSKGYAKHLVENEQISPGRLRTVPCWVNGETFRYNQGDREFIRGRLDIGDSLVCVYLGQFGGLYYELEAFNALRVLRDTINQPIHFLLLTPADQDRIKLALCQQGLHGSEYSALYADHADIPGYLSAADFAISFHRSIPMAFSYSPIKYGEYWSCGLPVIAPERVGDDSIWIDEDGLGCTADFSNEKSIKCAAGKIVQYLEDPHYRETIRSRGSFKRSKEMLINVYDEIIENHVINR